MDVLKNRAVLVTGGTRGIGRAVALRLAAMGADVAVNYVRNEEAAAETLALLKPKAGRAIALQGNVGDPAEVEKLVEKTAAEFGRLNIVVHCAALGAFKPVHKLKLNQWDLSLDVNAKAFLVLAQKALPWLEKEKDASVIALSSLGAHRFTPNYGAIGISKAALETLVKYLAVEFAPRGIRVNCVSGGPVDTDAIKFFPDFERVKAEVIARTPAGRIAAPDDLAAVVAFLVSPDARWIFGQTLTADGGLSLV